MIPNIQQFGFASGEERTRPFRVPGAATRLVTFRYHSLFEIQDHGATGTSGPVKEKLSRKGHVQEKFKKNTVYAQKTRYKILMISAVSYLI